MHMMVLSNRFAHLINIDFFADLMSVLHSLAETGVSVPVRMHAVPMHMHADPWTCMVSPCSKCPDAGASVPMDKHAVPMYMDYKLSLSSVAMA